MTLTNFMMSSETRDKLRRQSNFVENLVLGKMYKINEIQCCLEPIDKDGKDRRAMMFYLDEVGNKYSFLKLRKQRELMKYLNSALPTQEKKSANAKTENCVL